MGTAAVQGELRGAKARDWAQVQEPAWAPVFARALDLAGVGPGTRMLDIGCGAGGALVLARGRGAEVAGLGASAALVALARARLPGARIEVGGGPHGARLLPAAVAAGGAAGGSRDDRGDDGAAGLAPAAAGTFEAALAYPSHDLALRAFLSAGIATRIERQAGPEPVRTALAEALSPLARPDGTVSLTNDFRWVRATH